MGPSKGIVSTSLKINGPKQSCWQQQLQMQWAHPWASTAPLRKSMGRRKAIGSILLNYGSRPPRSILPFSLNGRTWAFPSSWVNLQIALLTTVAESSTCKNVPMFQFSYDFQHST